MNTSNTERVYSLSYFLFIFSLYYAPILNFYLPATNFGAGLPDVGFHELILLLWVGAISVDVALGRLAPRIRTPWIGLLGLYSFFVIISVSWSQERYSSATIRDLFYHILVPYIVASFALSYAAHERYRQNLVKHTAMGGLILSIIAIANFIKHYGGSIDEMRSGATLQNPNALAIFLVMGIPVVLYAIRAKVLSSVLAYPSLLCVIGGIVSTVSRKGIVTAGISFFLFFLAIKNYKALFAAALIATPVVLATTNITPVAKRFEQGGINVQIEGKWNMTIAGWDMFLKHPIKGLGYKGYYNEFGNYFPYSVRRKYDAHNNFITALANYGLIGSIPFVSVFLLPLSKSVKYLWRSRKKSSPDLRLKYATGMAVVIPFMLSAWYAGDLMYMPAVTNVLYVLIAMFCISPQESTPVPSARRFLGSALK